MLTAALAGNAAPAGAAVRGGNAKTDDAPPTRRVIELREGALPLARGATGPMVADVQQRLGITADGIFGPQTERAVRAFQLRNGLAVDGIVGPITWSALFGAQSIALPAAASGGKGGSRAAEVTVAAAFQPRRPLERLQRRLERRARKAGFGATRLSGGAYYSPPVPDPALDPGTTAAPQPPQGIDGSGPALGSCSSTTRPVKGVVTSPFGAPRPGHRHSGIDIAAPTGTPVRAFTCGTVTNASAESGYGNIVCVRHSATFATCYAHLSGFAVRSGQRVATGQVIGYVGCTGNCSGPHLHFETRVNGRPVDPAGRLAAAGSNPVRSAARASAHRSPAKSRKLARGVAPRASTTARWSQPPATERTAAASPAATPAPAPTSEQRVASAPANDGAAGGAGHSAAGSSGAASTKPQSATVERNPGAPGSAAHTGQGPSTSSTTTVPAPAPGPAPAAPPTSSAGGGSQQSAVTSTGSTAAPQFAERSGGAAAPAPSPTPASGAAATSPPAP